MPAIGQFTFLQWNGVIKPPRVRMQLLERTGLAGYGVGFDTEMMDPAEITTREIIAIGNLGSRISQYRAAQTTSVAVRDGTETPWTNVLVLKVADITWEQMVQPTGSYLLAATWTLLPDIFGN